MKNLPEIRLLLVDDHALFSDGLVLQLDTPQSSVTVVGQVFQGDEVLPAISQYQPDVVLLDINLPQVNGIECARQIIDSYPDVRIIMLTMYDYQKLIDECRSIGVSGYLLKSERAETILRVIERVYAGETHFPALPARPHFENNVFISHYKLTPTEVKIISLIHQGLSSQQIADQLFISFETVKSHRKNIYRKLNISSLAELINFANEYAL
ncbi:response regulator [Spirosoma koreense]